MCTGSPPARSTIWSVNTDGRREVLGVATGASEAEVFWTEFLRSLADRGLRGVKLVIADDHKGCGRPPGASSAPASSAAACTGPATSWATRHPSNGPRSPP